MAVPHIFVSYYFAGTSHRDYQFAMQLAADLRARGTDVVVDEATIPDEQVKAYLNHVLPQCQWFILIQTPEALSSPRVRLVVDTALNAYLHGRLKGMLAVLLVPPEYNAAPLAWRSVMLTCDASQNYQDGLFQVSQILELARHNPSLPYEQQFTTLVAPSSPPPPNEDEQDDTIVPHSGDSHDMGWAGPMQWHSQDMPGTGPAQEYGQDAQNTAFPLARGNISIPLAPRFTLSRIPRHLWLILIAVALVVLLAVGLLISVAGHFGSAQSGVPVDASKNATATAIATNANATAFAMAFTPQGLYALVMQRQPTLSDPLSAQDNNQWGVNTSSAGGCAFTGGAYHASITVANQHTACMSRKAEFKNFAYQAQVTLLSGDAGGLIFRSDSAVSTFYRFGIDSTGAYRLFSCKGCTGNQNAGTVVAFGDIGVKANQPNILTVIAINNTIDLYVNGQFVKSVNDATSDAGEIGVYAGTFVQAFMHPTEVAFSNAKVWML